MYDSYKKLSVKALQKLLLYERFRGLDPGAFVTILQENYVLTHRVIYIEK